MGAGAQVSAGSQIDFSDLGGRPVGGRPVSGGTPSGGTQVSQTPVGSPVSQAGPMDFSDLGGRVVGNAVKVIDKQGNISTIPEAQINAARQQGKMPTPDSGVKMITPEGQITYALPQEVGKFLASGHVLVNRDGTFNVTPLPGEDPSDTMARAAKIGKAVTPEMIQGEEKHFTPKRLAATLAAGPVVGGLTLGAIAGASAGASALVSPVSTTGEVVTGIDAAGNPITSTVTATSPSVLSNAMQGLKAAATSPTAVTVYKYLANKVLPRAIEGGIWAGLMKGWLSKGE